METPNSAFGSPARPHLVAHPLPSLPAALREIRGVGHLFRPKVTHRPCSTTKEGQKAGVRAGMMSALCQHAAARADLAHLWFMKS
jgi:hypothetical protein